MHLVNFTHRKRDNFNYCMYFWLSKHHRQRGFDVYLKLMFRCHVNRKIRSFVLQAYLMAPMIIHKCIACILPYNCICSPILLPMAEVFPCMHLRFIKGCDIFHQYLSILYSTSIPFEYIPHKNRSRNSKYFKIQMYTILYLI